MYFKFGVTEAWESIETENTIHFEPHPFLIFHILKCSAAFVSAWLNIKFTWQFTYIRASEKFRTLHTNKSKTGIYEELPT